MQGNVIKEQRHLSDQVASFVLYNNVDVKTSKMSFLKKILSAFNIVC